MLNYLQSNQVAMLSCVREQGGVWPAGLRRRQLIDAMFREGYLERDQISEIHPLTRLGQKLYIFGNLGPMRYRRGTYYDKLREHNEAVRATIKMVELPINFRDRDRITFLKWCVANQVCVCSHTREYSAGIESFYIAEEDYMLAYLRFA